MLDPWRIAAMGSVRTARWQVDAILWYPVFQQCTMSIVQLRITRRAAVLCGMAINCRAKSRRFRLELRSRIEAFKGSGNWREVRFSEEFDTARSAVLICDMWDKHWCTGANQRVEEMVVRMNPAVEAARKAGIHIIHAPSETMEFYKNVPQRRRVQSVPAVPAPKPLELPDPPLPIDDRSGGCETRDRVYKAWTRQHPGLRIAPEDAISDRGNEIYSFMMNRGVDTIFFMGVHTNMCVLNRTFAIKNMTRWGMRSVLIRDLTDSMYDPADAPYVSHQRGTDLVVEHIERHWCPSALSRDLIRAI